MTDPGIRGVRARLEGLRCETDHPLAPHTTYRVGGPADLAVFPRGADELARAVREVRAADLPLAVLGLGSNVLVADRGVRGVVIILRDLDGIRREGERLVVGAGADCTAVAAEALSAGLTGLEFFHYLPGSVGGAAFMNARAFEQEMSQVWCHACQVTREGALVEREYEPGMFRYKHSPLQDSGELAAQLTLQLTSGDPATIRSQMDYNEQKRRANGELEWPSCGCVFKNDRRFGAPSGRLIDEAGLKEYAVGGARVSPRHANFVINAQEARAADIRAVIEHVQRSVECRTGHRMEYEVRLLGQW